MASLVRAGGADATHLLIITSWQPDRVCKHPAPRPTALWVHVGQLQFTCQQPDMVCEMPQFSAKSLLCPLSVTVVLVQLMRLGLHEVWRTLGDWHHNQLEPTGSAAGMSIAANRVAASTDIWF